MSTAKPMDLLVRVAGYVNQRKPGYSRDTQVVTPRQWRRVGHKERRRKEYDPDLSYLVKLDAKTGPTPRRRTTASRRDEEAERPGAQKA